MSRGSLAARRPPTPPTPPPPPTRPRLSLNDRLVRERDRERARELFRTLGLGILVLVPLLLHVWQQVTFVETAYRVSDLRAERGRIEKSLRILGLERASLESLDRIEREARRSGMILPPPEAVVTVTSESPEIPR